MYSLTDNNVKIYSTKLYKINVLKYTKCYIHKKLFNITLGKMIYKLKHFKLMIYANISRGKVMLLIHKDTVK